MLLGSTSLRLSPPSLVFPFFLLSGISFFIAAILLCISYDNFGLHYAHPKLIAITHVLILGFITSIIFGSLYQMLPILFEVELKHIKLGMLSFYSLLLGLILLIPNFWTFKIGLWFHAGACITLLSFVFFSFVFLNSFLKSPRWSVEYDFIFCSVMWLLLTGLIGVLLIFNFSHLFIPISHIEILKIHSHMGIIGWVLQLIIGISSRLIPMFVISKNISTKNLKYSFYLINIGLVLFGASIYLSQDIQWIYLAIGMIEVGVCLFLYFMYTVFSKRLRRTMDTSLWMSFGSFVILLLLLPIAVLVPSSILQESTMMSFRIVYGVLILLGFSGSLILGQALKLVPFIVWMYRFQKISGHQSTPTPKDLVSEKISTYVQYLFWIGLMGLIVFIMGSFPIGILLSSCILVVSAILFNINIIKALMYPLSPIKHE